MLAGACFLRDEQNTVVCWGIIYEIFHPRRYWKRYNKFSFFCINNYPQPTLCSFNMQAREFIVIAGSQLCFRKSYQTSRHMRRCKTQKRANLLRCPKQCGSFPQRNTWGMFCSEYSSPTFLQYLCCQQISWSSSLLKGYDEPEILLDQIVKSVPKALTLDKLHFIGFGHCTQYI